jgi:hypothetical protein
MPTSLVSTGVQFPDSTTQTTALPAPGSNGNVLTSNGTTWTSAAPSGSGGATQVGSVCLKYNSGRLYYAANPAAQTAAPFFSSANMLTINNGASINAYFPPKYSTYYGGWLTWGQTGNTWPTDGFIFFSTNGLNWIPFVYGPNNSFAKQVCNDGMAAIAVDETNGRIFIAAQNTGNNTSGVYYSSAPATTNNNTWTYNGFDDSGQVYGECPAINSMEWVQFTSTTANGAIVFCSGVVNDSTARVYTIAAGATTGTLRVTYAPSGGNVNGGYMVWNKTFQRIAIFHTGGTGVRYSATNSFASWSNSTMPSAANVGPGSSAMSGSRLACRTSGTNLRYTSDFSTWSTETIPQEFTGIWHNGTSWVGARGAQPTGDTGGIYYTNNTNPTSWVRAVGGVFDTGTGVALRSN